MSGSKPFRIARLSARTLLVLLDAAFLGIVSYLHNNFGKDYPAAYICLAFGFAADIVDFLSSWRDLLVFCTMLDSLAWGIGIPGILFIPDWNYCDGGEDGENGCPVRPYLGAVNVAVFLAIAFAIAHFIFSVGGCVGYGVRRYRRSEAVQLDQLGQASARSQQVDTIAHGK